MDGRLQEPTVFARSGADPALPVGGANMSEPQDAASESTFQEIAYEVSDGVLTLTLDRPDALNALTNTTISEIIDAFDRSDADDEVRVVVVTGRGRGFCAGADLAAGGDTFNADRRQRPASETIDGVPRDGGGQVSLRVAASLKPVIAAVNGPAVGVGVT